MKLAKKVLTIVSLATMGISVIMLIGAIFGLKVFQGALLSLLLSFATIAVASAFSINGLNIMRKKKIIAYVSIGLLGLVSLLGLIIYWSKFTTAPLFNQITGVLAIATVFFNIIVSLNLKLDKKYLVLQIITFSIICIVDIILTLLIFGVNVLSNDLVSKLFWALCLVAFGLLCTVAILSRKNREIEENDKEKYIRVKQSEYTALKERVEFLEKEIESLKK